MLKKPAGSSLLLDLSKVDPSTALNAWLIYHNLSKKELSQRLGVGPSTVTRLIAGQRRSPRLRAALEQMGIPSTLLP
ncbi:MAG: helix-turn-helix domain-containing protein [Thermodesulfobacteriota bacterium]